MFSKHIVLEKEIKNMATVLRKKQENITQNNLSATKPRTNQNRAIFLKHEQPETVTILRPETNRQNRTQKTTNQ